MDTEKPLERVDFLEYLSTEEHNLLATMNNLRQEFELFFNLNQVYKAPLSRLSPDPDDVLIPQLYFFVHYNFYAAIANLMRVHLADAMGSTRRAIDGAFSAYEIILFPEKAKDYIASTRQFQFIKAHIAKAQKADTAAYPLALELVGLHEQCSSFGSHADIVTFAHRTRFFTDSKNQRVSIFDYFQKPDDEHEFRYYYLCVLHAFLRMFEIVRLYFDRELNIIDVTWEAKIVELGKRIPAMRRKEYEASERKS